MFKWFMEILSLNENAWYAHTCPNVSGYFLYQFDMSYFIFFQQSTIAYYVSKVCVIHSHQFLHNLLEVASMPMPIIT
jgi:hypothetical protein